MHVELLPIYRIRNDDSSMFDVLDVIYLYFFIMNLYILS